ncbi:terminase large subunit [Pseudomonas phage vB_PaeM_PS24]|uniref:Terminase-like family protein n=1 Tax=Pseudomonas phage vB_PaeM_PS24 TaxID=1542092 RepID=A0A0K0L9D5_9CAUD|nr:terminase large subunit [Pseudomonas phage vB_PaeM_PS24]AIW01755.1 terminase-like family protein [Pseudomonas phage vB_PaeM_PS24]
MTKTVIGPKSPKQEAFINSTANITVFGGAAGAGKSYLGVMDFLKHVKYPMFRGLITRRTTPQIKGPGGILDNCLQLYKQFDKNVKWKDKDGKFVFSSGAEIHLRHFAHIDDKDNYQGLEINEFLVDEGQQYTLEMLLYLMSRMRGPKCPEVEPHMKITCNPDYNSPLRKWLTWYLDPETGIPIPERDGITRFFTIQNGDMEFADTAEELIEKYNLKSPPLTFKFISANVYDNPVVMEINPQYVAWLEGLNRVEKLRLLHGSWFAREEASGYFKREWTPIIPLRPTDTVRQVRAWDISGTLPSDSNKEPDWTAGVLMSKGRSTLYTIEDVVRDRRRIGGVFELILETARHDGADTTILIPRDPGAAGQHLAWDFVRRLAEHGFHARTRPTNKSKVTRFGPFASMAEAGGVQVVEGPWNEAYLTELEVFDGSRNVKDDQVDATSDAYTYLASDIHIPNFIPPDLTRPNPLAIER